MATDPNKNQQNPDQTTVEQAAEQLRSERPELQVFVSQTLDPQNPSGVPIERVITTSIGDETPYRKTPADS